MSWAYWLRLFNALLAGNVVGLCFLKVRFDYINRARNMRVAGLGTIGITIAWGSFAHRNDVFSVRILVTTVGLLLSIAGMRRLAAGEEAERKVT